MKDSITNMEEDILYKEESYAIIGACFEVYNEKGNGFLEAVYQECLRLEFKLQNIPFVAKPRLGLDYKGNRLEQAYEPDFLCFENIILELKAIKKITGEHRAQVFNYLRSSNHRLGLLVNFGTYPNLEHERIVL